MAEEKYAGITSLKKFLEKAKSIFAPIKHTHDASEINGIAKTTVKTEAEWKSDNPILEKDEIAVSSDKNGMYKVGDGTNTWAKLTYNDSNAAKYDSSGNIIDKSYIKDISVNNETKNLTYTAGDGTNHDIAEAATMLNTGEEIKTTTDGNAVAGAVGVKEGLETKVETAKVLSNEEFNATISERGYIADAKDVKDAITSLNSSLDTLMPKSGGTFTGTVIHDASTKFNHVPQTKYNNNYYLIPTSRTANGIQFAWTANGLEIYIDNTYVGAIGANVIKGKNASFSVVSASGGLKLPTSGTGITFGNDIYMYRESNGTLWCRIGSSDANYKYKQIAP